MLGHLGLAVNRLIRVSFGPFQLGELAEGAVEEVKTRVLREQLGERIVAQAGADFSAPVIGRDEPEAQTPVRHPEARVQRRSRRKPTCAQFRNRVNPIRWTTARAPRPCILRGPLRGRLRMTEQDCARTARKPDGRTQPRLARAQIGGERDKPLRRTFRGARRAEKEQREQAATAKRAGLLTDRKGRRVLVERIASAAPPSRHLNLSTSVRRNAARRGRPDRAAGPRPARPRPERPLMRIVGGPAARARAGRAEIAGDPPDRRPAARGAVQYPGARLRRSGHRRARARPVRRHRRARASRRCRAARPSRCSSTTAPRRAR